MPELPEVESFKKYVDNTSLHQQINEVLLADDDLLVGTTADQLIKLLTNNRFISTFRQGKFLFIKLEREGWLILHFGMTGDLLYYKQDTGKPKVYILLIKFEGGNNLLFSDWRKFGMISVTESPEDFMAKRKYGKDALLITLDEFINTFKKLKKSIKTALIDQHHVAGVGNEFSDEILFQAEIHPASKANKLRYEILEAIYNYMQSILKEAVSQDADRKKLRHYFFLGNRKAGLTCPHCGGKTATATIGGRSSYFCPSCQKLIQ